MRMAGRSFLAASILLVSTMGHAAMADQNDPRLDGLFARLEVAEDPASARFIEEQIWSIWLAVEDDQNERLLEAGMTAMAAGSFGTAKDAFDELVQRSPDFAEGWNKRATLFWLMGDYEASVLDIQQTLRLEPRHFGALSGLGLIYMAIDQPEAAVRSFEAALDLHPFLPGARQNIEMLQRRLGGEPL